MALAKWDGKSWNKQTYALCVCESVDIWMRMIYGWSLGR